MILAAGTACALGVLLAWLLGRRRPAAGPGGGPRRVGGYRLIEPIASGAMGDVWLAEHERLGRMAAVKLIRADRVDGERREVALLRFEREARTLARLRSPHTVTLFEYGEEPDGTRFYAMELLDGVDLETLVDRTGPFPPARALLVLRQVAAALGEAHAQGILHRDVKPANVVLCQGDFQPELAKVLDFGLATHLREEDPRATQDGMTVGTPLVMAPEVIQGEPADARSDVYSLGCVAYWLLTGRYPLQGHDQRATLMAHLTREAVPPSRRRRPGTIPPMLDVLVLDCLEKDAARRPGSMAELAARLDRLARLLDPWTREDAAGAWREWDALEDESSPVAALPADPRAATAPVLRFPRCSTRRLVRSAG